MALTTLARLCETLDPLDGHRLVYLLGRLHMARVLGEMEAGTGAVYVESMPLSTACSVANFAHPEVIDTPCGVHSSEWQPRICL